MPKKKMKIFYIEYTDSVKFFNDDKTLELQKRKNTREIFESCIS